MKNLSIKNGTVAIEYFVMMFLIVGIIIGNRPFVQIGFKDLYVFEFLVATIAAFTAVKLFILSADRDFKEYVLNERFSPFYVLLAYGVFQLLVGEHSVLAIRQSMMLFYSGLVFVFILVFSDLERLKASLMLLLIPSVVLIAGKLIYYKSTGVYYDIEPDRVMHNEVDTIAVPIACIGLILFAKELVNRYGRFVFFCLCILALIALALPFKRTSFIGLLAVGVAMLTTPMSRGLIGQVKKPLLLLLIVAAVALLSAFFFLRHFMSI